jgi:hypothetical protein
MIFRCNNGYTNVLQYYVYMYIACVDTQWLLQTVHFTAGLNTVEFFYHPAFQLSRSHKLNANFSKCELCLQQHFSIHGRNEVYIM